MDIEPVTTDDRSGTRLAILLVDIGNTCAGVVEECGLPWTYVPHDDDTFSTHVDGLVAFANLVSARAAAVEREKVDALVEALTIFVQHFGDPFQCARAALAKAQGDGK